MALDLRLIAILDEAVLAGRDLVAAARDAVAGGATVVQLRMKTAPAATWCRTAEALVRTVSVPVFVNDRADVAWAVGAHGVHLGAADLPPAAVRALAPPPFLIGVSVGSPAEAADVSGTAVDYWSIGSVYSTASKADAGPPIGVEGFRALARLRPAGMPIVAIGGIDASNAAAVMHAGADGVAVISALFGGSDVRRAARAIRDAVDAARH